MKSSLVTLADLDRRMAAVVSNFVNAATHYSEESSHIALVSIESVIDDILAKDSISDDWINNNENDSRGGNNYARAKR